MQLLKGRPAGLRSLPIQKFSFRSIGLRAYTSSLPRLERTQYYEPTGSSPPPNKKPWGRTLAYGIALLGLSYFGYSLIKDRIPNASSRQWDHPSKKTLVILGSGWGSVSLLKKIDTSNYNVVVVSPRNFFLFTPLLPSCTTGTIEHRSVMEPIRTIIRKKQSDVTYYEASATKIDYENRKLTISNGQSQADEKAIDFDFLVIGVGAMNSTFGIPGVEENAHFLKEVTDAQKIRKKIMDNVERASFKNLDDEDRKRLLHTVVVGGGPTGVEFAAELQDFFEEDLRKWVPEIAKDFRVTLVEALPNLLPSFSKQLIEYTHKAFEDENITVLTKTMVKQVDEASIVAAATNVDGSKETVQIPYGLLVWATGNTIRPVIRDLMSRISAQHNSRRGLLVDDHLVVEGTEGIWALGDCTASKYPPTAQVAFQQGSYLGDLFNQLARANRLQEEIAGLSERLGNGNEDEKRTLQPTVEAKTQRLNRVASLAPFEYIHQGSLAYVGSDLAVADLSMWGQNNFSSGGRLTNLFWRSAYISMCFSARNKVLVLLDWFKVTIFGRDVCRES